MFEERNESVFGVEPSAVASAVCFHGQVAFSERYHRASLHSILFMCLPVSGDFHSIDSCVCRLLSCRIDQGCM